jgi:hypothetical protein
MQRLWPLLQATPGDALSLRASLPSAFLSSHHGVLAQSFPSSSVLFYSEPSFFSLPSSSPSSHLFFLPLHFPFSFLFPSLNLLPFFFLLYSLLLHSAPLPLIPPFHFLLPFLSLSCSHLQLSASFHVRSQVAGALGALPTSDSLRSYLCHLCQPWAMLH